MKPTLTIFITLLLTSFAGSPDARAQTPETGAKSTGPKPKTSPAPIQFGYRPDGMSMWDPWFVAHEGQVHLFHLQKRAGSNRTDAGADHIGPATSRDLIRWTEQPLTVGPGEKGGIEDLQPWTGCAVVKDGVFHLFYTMRSSRDDARNQHIGLATSRDLMNWQRHSGNPVIAPDPRWYVHEGKPEPDKKVGCRDMKIVRDPAGNGWIGFFAATVPAEEEAEAACIALARSKDPHRRGDRRVDRALPAGGGTPAFAGLRLRCLALAHHDKNNSGGTA